MVQDNLQGLQYQTLSPLRELYFFGAGMCITLDCSPCQVRAFKQRAPHEHIYVTSAQAKPVIS